MGIFKWNTVNEAIDERPDLFNLETPPYRDTFLNDFTGTMWVALRYQVTHPGAWLLHCHFETHLSNGMAMAIMDGVDVWPTVPPEYANNGKGLRIEAPELSSTVSESTPEAPAQNESEVDKSDNEAQKTQIGHLFEVHRALFVSFGAMTVIFSLVFLGWCKGIYFVDSSKKSANSSTLQFEEVQSLLAPEGSSSQSKRSLKKQKSKKTLKDCN